MNKRILVVTTVLILSILSCNLFSSSSTGSSQSQSSASGSCSNAYYPVKEGVTRTYSTTGLPTGLSTYTETISDISSSGFTLTSQFDKITRTAKWNCTKEGLLELELGGGAASLDSSNGMQANFTVTKSTGVTLPVKISAGDTWSYSLDFTSSISIANTNQQYQGTATYQVKALDIEKVTVPAGTFNAIKLQIATSMTMQMMSQGAGAPILITDTSNAWFAPNVGMVKQADDLSMMGTTINSSTELQSYKIP